MFRVSDLGFLLSAMPGYAPVMFPNSSYSCRNISYSCKGTLQLKTTLIKLLEPPFVSIKRGKGRLPDSITEFIPVYFTGLLCTCFIQPVNIRPKQFAGRTQDIIQCSQLPQSEIAGHFVQRKNDCKTCIKQAVLTLQTFINTAQMVGDAKTSQCSELYLLIRLILAFNPLIPLYNCCPLFNLLVKIEFL